MEAKDEKIKLNIDGKVVTCLKKESKTESNTCIILPGATTIHLDYIPMIMTMASNVIVINNPDHGTKGFKSEGPAITDASVLIDFHVKVIKALIEKGYATNKINVVGYSMGGMSIINILNRKLLNGIVEKAVILCSNIVTRDGAINEAKSLYNKGNNTFAVRELVLKALTKYSPWFMYITPVSLLTANANSCYSDCLICDSMDEISKNERREIGLPVKVTAVIGVNDFFFDENDVPNLESMFESFNLVKIPNGHMVPLENFLGTAKIIEDAFK